jgi:hypothetical protein
MAASLRFCWLQLLRQCAAAVVVGDVWSQLAASLAVFPGRAGAPLSLGSVLGAAVARFLPHGFRGAEVRVLDVDMGNVVAACVSPDGTRFTTVDEYNCAAVFDDDGELLCMQDLGVKIRRLVSARNNMLYAAEEDGDVQIWTPTLKPYADIRPFFEGADAVNDLVVDGDELYVAMRSCIQVFDIPTRTYRRLIPRRDVIRLCVAHVGGKTVLLGATHHVVTGVNDIHLFHTVEVLEAGGRVIYSSRVVQSLAFDARTGEVFIVDNMRLVVRHLDSGEAFRRDLHLNKVAWTHDVTVCDAGVVLFQTCRDTNCFRICVYE